MMRQGVFLDRLGNYRDTLLKMLTMGAIDLKQFKQQRLALSAYVYTNVNGAPRNRKKCFPLFTEIPEMFHSGLRSGSKYLQVTPQLTQLFADHG